ncbi:hypothetical protein HDU67_001212 [Dinochytrium kinnereticum]|nr:hypothetical protein HDU67_001212 [Dinochytrium kinnereticum]
MATSIKQMSPNAAKERPPRKVFVNIEPSEDLFKGGKPVQSFPPNSIRTTKYTVFTFIFKNLYEQFRRIANMFFLCLVILQFFPEYQTINPFVAAIPLTAVILMTAAKDGMEDWKRHKSDIAMNSQASSVLSGSWRNTNAPFHKCKGPPGSTEPPASVTKSLNLKQEELEPGSTPEAWRKTMWGSVKVGDIVLLRNDEAIPADVAILATSEPECLCYVETKNLDGETNLKIRKGLSETSFLDPKSMKDFDKLQFRIESEPPNSNLFSFKSTAIFTPSTISFVAEKLGHDSMSPCLQSMSSVWESEVNTIHLEDSNQLLSVPLSMSGYLLRGCVLRNTDWLIGLVIFTGEETKICLNAGETPSKQSRIDIGMNHQVASLITFQNIVPISLYITLEIVKTFQAFFISMDLEMYFEKIDQPCFPRSWNLADDLGQIDYIFSDKTGTLTQNIMQFRKCSINGVIYGGALPTVFNFHRSVRSSTTTLTAIALRHSGDMLGRNSIAAGHRISKVSMKSRHRIRARKKRIAPVLDRPIDSAAPPGKTLSFDEDIKKEPAFFDTRLQSEITNVACGQYSAIRDFFTSLAVCHSVLVSGDISNGPNAIKYLSQSPDEAALVQAAKDIGFVFLSRAESSITVDVLGEQENCTMLNIIEFNSTRKRMSVIVRRPAGEIVLYCKGADSVIYESILPEGVYSEWSKKYHEAAISLSDREEKIDAVAEEIEQNMLLIGATAIEDKLQDGVPECIERLSRAGIKLWVLTGDKMETAINIGLSCNLLTKDMNLILIKGENGKDLRGDVIHQQIVDALTRFWDFSFSKDGKAIAPGKNPDTLLEIYGLVIDGSALVYALDPSTIEVFLELATRCGAVICCRVSPLQKAQVVEMVKSRRNALCLAIGDGANDVSMIQAANVGVGIAGEEGLQAVMASDYAIGQFRFLLRLLLVHGHWSYVRTASMILNFFFKSLIWVDFDSFRFCLFWFQIYCGFSAEVNLDLTFMLLYNVVLSSLPVIAMGVFDQDISDITALAFPMAYRADRRFAPFTLLRFTCFVVESAYQAIVCFYFIFFGFGEVAFDSGGRLLEKPELSVVLSIVAVLNANAFIAVNMNSWNSLSIATMVITQALPFLYTAIYSVFPFSLVPGIVGPLFASPLFWLNLLITSLLCQFPRIIFLYGKRSFFPTDVHILQERRGHTVTMDDCGRAMSFERSQAAIEPVSFKHMARSSEYRPSIGSDFKHEALSIGEQLSKPMLIDEPRFSSGSRLPPDFEPPPRSARSEPDIPAIALTAVEVERQHSSGSMYSMASVARTPAKQAFNDDALSAPVEKVNMLTVMKTGQMLRNRGYSFSQSPGARDIIMGRHSVCAAEMEIQDPPKVPKRTSSTPLFVRTNTAPQ